MRLFSNRWQKSSKCGKDINDTLGYRLVRHFFVLTTFWRHLWSITGQMHGNIESISIVNYTECVAETISWHWVSCTEITQINTKFLGNTICQQMQQYILVQHECLILITPLLNTTVINHLYCIFYIILNSVLWLWCMMFLINEFTTTILLLRAYYYYIFLFFRKCCCIGVWGCNNLSHSSAASHRQVS